MTTSGAFGPGRVFRGVDLAWRNEHAGLAPNETGVAAIGADGGSWTLAGPPVSSKRSPGLNLLLVQVTRSCSSTRPRRP